jgi:hypothetical protein
VSVANKPSPIHVAHNAFDAIEGDAGVRSIMHRQNDAGDDLDQERHSVEHSEIPEVVEIAGNGITATGDRKDEAWDRQLPVEPDHERAFGFVSPCPWKAHGLPPSILVTAGPSRHQRGD